MSNLTPFPSRMEVRPQPRHVRELIASQHAVQISAELQAADAALGNPVPDRKPSVYHELAAQAIGQLDPARAKVAEFRGYQVVYADLLEMANSPRMTAAQREDVVRHAFRHGLIVYQMTLEGRLPASEIDGRRVSAEGKVIA